MTMTLRTLYDRWRYAVRNDDLPTVQALLASHRKRLDLENREGIDGEPDHSSLDLAALHSSPALIQTLLDAGAQVNAQGAWGNTALHHAAGRGRDAALRTLLAAGADVNAVAVALITPLMRAARVGVPEATRVLLEAGANVALVDQNGQSALHRSTHHACPEVALALMDAGADPWAVDGNGQAFVHGLCEGVMAEDLLPTLVQRAQAAHRPWDVPDAQGHRPLHLAVKKGRLRAVQALLDLGVPPDQRVEGDADAGSITTALDLARSYHQPGIFDLLQAALVAREQAALRSVMPPDALVPPLPPDRAGRRL